MHLTEHQPVVFSYSRLVRGIFVNESLRYAYGKTAQFLMADSRSSLGATGPELLRVHMLQWNCRLCTS